MSRNVLQYEEYFANNALYLLILSCFQPKTMWRAYTTMFVFQNNLSYHKKLMSNRQQLIAEYVNLYQKQKQLDSGDLDALRAYILHINQGKIPITFDDPLYIALTQTITPSEKIGALTHRCKNIAETRAKHTMLLACLRETLTPVLALILPCFIIGAGIATALTHTGTLSAVLFFLTLGGLMLLGSQLYIWRHHRKNEPNRLQRLNKLMSECVKPSVEISCTGEVFSEHDLKNMLDEKMQPLAQEYPLSNACT